MSNSEFFATVTAWVPVGVLFLSGIGHLASSKHLRTQLLVQSVIPRHLVTPAALALGSVEFSIGGLGFAGLLGYKDIGSSLGTVLVLTAALYVAYAAFAAYVVLKRPGAPCGCSVHEHKASVWSVTRAGLLGLSASVSRLQSGGEMQEPLTNEGMFAPLAILALAAIIWNLPKALEEPILVAPEGSMGQP